MIEDMTLESISLERTSRRKSEVVIYYRRPMKGEHAGWITWGDSQPSKRADMVLRGFEPLPQFGRIATGVLAFDQYGVWGPILTHPRGPAVFPAEQVITFRWYDPEQVGDPWRPIPNVKFPQLKGQKIVEFDCPECSDRVFAKALHLARHLRNTHDYDRSEIIKLGEELGIDFTKEFTVAGKREFTYQDDAPLPVPREEDEGPSFEVTKTKVSGRS